MKLYLTIIFSFLISLGYAQRTGDSLGYYKDTELGRIKILTSEMIKEKLSGTAWVASFFKNCFIRNGKLMESEYIYYNELDIGDWTSHMLYFYEDERVYYVLDFSDRIGMSKKTINPHRDNEIFFVNSDESTLFMCINKIQPDGSLFAVLKFSPCNFEAIEQAEYRYCLSSTHFTIIDKMETYEFFDYIYATNLCPTPQNPDRRITLPFPEIKQRKYRRVNK